MNDQTKTGFNKNINIIQDSPESTNHKLLISMELFSLSNLIDIAMIVGPSLGFLIQVIKIKQTNTSEGFSKLLILVLLVANIFRVFFWIGKQFSLVILYQSILMILAQFYLLYICLKYSDIGKYYIKNKQQILYSSNSSNNYNNNKNDNSIIAVLSDTINDIKGIITYKPVNYFDISKFWNWNFFIDYFYFISIFVLMLILSSKVIGIDNPLYMETLGSLAAGVEALIGIPQAYSNFSTKSTGALSYGMILTWVFGDTFKTYYYYNTLAPVQLIICGFFQLTVDFLLILQLTFYDSIETNSKDGKTIKFDQNYSNSKSNNNRKENINYMNLVDLSTEDQEDNMFLSHDGINSEVDNQNTDKDDHDSNKAVYSGRSNRELNSILDCSKNNSSDDKKNEYSDDSDIDLTQKLKDNYHNNSMDTSNYDNDKSNMISFSNAL